MRSSQVNCLHAPSLNGVLSQSACFSSCIGRCRQQKTLLQGDASTDIAIVLASGDGAAGITLKVHWPFLCLLPDHAITSAVEPIDQRADR